MRPSGRACTLVSPPLFIGRATAYAMKGGWPGCAAEPLSPGALDELTPESVASDETRARDGDSAAAPNRPCRVERPHVSFGW